MTEGVVRFGKLDEKNAGDVFLDDQLICRYHRELMAGGYHWYLVTLDGKSIASRPTRGALVARIKEYAENCKNPVEVTIVLPILLARLIPDLVKLNAGRDETDPAKRDTNVPILFAMAQEHLRAAKARGRLKFSDDNALSIIALDIEKDAREAIFEIVSEAVAKLPA